MKPVHVSLSRERVGVGWRVLSVSIGSGAGDSGLASESARAELATQRGMTRRSEQTDLKPEKADKRIHSETEADRLLATDTRSGWLATHGFEHLGYFSSEFCISVQDHVIGRAVVGEGLSELLYDPAGGRMLRGVEMNDPPLRPWLITKKQ